jgi:hypothetical protein
MPESCEDSVFLPEQAERYGGAIFHGWIFVRSPDPHSEVENMKRVASSDQELTVSRSVITSPTWKNVIVARRASWRIVSRRPWQASHSLCRFKEVEGLLLSALGCFVANLVISARIGDYHRYLAEFATGNNGK